MDSCIAQFVHHPGDFDTYRNLSCAGKSSFTTCTTVLAAFLAVAEDCVLFRNLSQAFNWQQNFIQTAFKAAYFAPTLLV